MSRLLGHILVSTGTLQRHEDRSESSSHEPHHLLTRSLTCLPTTSAPLVRTFGFWLERGAVLRGTTGRRFAASASHERRRLISIAHSQTPAVQLYFPCEFFFFPRGRWGSSSSWSRGFYYDDGRTTASCGGAMPDQA